MERHHADIRQNADFPQHICQLNMAWNYFFRFSMHELEENPLL